MQNLLPALSYKVCPLLSLYTKPPVTPSHFELIRNEKGGFLKDLDTAPSAYIPQRETHETRNGGGGRTEEILYQVREVDRRIDSSSGPQGYDRYERHKPSRL